MNAPAAAGALILMPNALDHGTGQQVPLDEWLPRGVAREAASIGHWVVEDAKSARAFLQRVGAVVPLAQPLQAIDIRELPRPPKGASGAAAVPADAVLDALLAPLRAGHDVGLLSEAGMPAVADPGALLVARAQQQGFAVRPRVGPSSLLLALAASGLQGQSFAFVGYLPIERDARATRLRELEQLSRRAAQTQLMIEAPYRNAALWDALLATLQPTTMLTLASGLTLPQAECRTASVAAWRRQPARDWAAKVPAVFGLLGMPGR